MGIERMRPGGAFPPSKPPPAPHPPRAWSAHPGCTSKKCRPLQIGLLTMTLFFSRRCQSVPDSALAHCHKSRGQLRVEPLEDRTVPTLFTVNTTAMNLSFDGKVSLLEAITSANTNSSYGDAPAGS